MRRASFTKRLWALYLVLLVPVVNLVHEGAHVPALLAVGTPRSAIDLQMIRIIPSVEPLAPIEGVSRLFLFGRNRHGFHIDCSVCHLLGSPVSLHARLVALVSRRNYTSFGG